MKKLITFLFIFSCCFTLKAQLIKSGWVYGGSGNQSAIKSFIDNNGNRYQFIFYDSNFTIDSAGTPITILKNTVPGSPYSETIIKYDSEGKYLYHLRFYTTGQHFWENIDLIFSASNEAILCFTFSQNDSLSIYDSKGALYKTVKPAYNKKSTDNGNHQAAVVCKINSAGQFMWLNTIARETLPVNFNTGNFGKLVINYANEIRVCFPNIRENNLSISDTLSVTNNTGFKSLFFVNTKYVIFKFATGGNLLSVNEPLKNRLTFYHADSSYDQYTAFCPYIELLTDGYNTYISLNISTSKADTFKCANPVPLKIGHTTLLFKLNEHDSILWAKPILREIARNFSAPRMDFDTNTQELMLLVDIAPWYYEFLLNSSYSSSYGSYLCKISTAGNLIWQDLYINSFINSTNFNYVTKQYVLTGSTNGNDIRLQNFTPPNLVNKPFSFVAYLDSLGNIFSAQPIVSRDNQTVNTIQFSLFNLGSITDSKGRSYISGWFTDSISLPCRKLHALIESTQYGTPLSDGFVLALEPYLPITLSACKQISSPSSKYVWDSSGYYFDTIPNSLGCDSILWVHFKRLQSSSRLDSGVCKNMRSYSGKYNWNVSGIYKDTIPNVKGCDSIITVHLSVLQSVHVIDSTVKTKILAPDGRRTWDSTGTYYDTLITARGCDSILIIHLTVLQSKSAIDTIACRSLLSPSGKYHFTSTGNYIDTLLNKQNGDSIITIRLKILQSYYSIDTTYCGAYKTPSGRYYVDTSGTYYDTIPNSNHCDSIITINFIKTNTIDSITLESCTTLTSPSGKYLYKISGVYVDTLQSNQHCDSILYIHYKRLTSYSNITQTACDTFTSPSGKCKYAVSGIYTDTISNSKGCDSVISIDLIIKPLQLSVAKSNNITCDSPLAYLNATGGNTYLWQPAQGLSNSNISNPIANPKVQTMYHVMSTDATGCKALDSIELFVSKDDTIKSLPNAFSPNGDGINDCISINEVTQFKEVEFSIYNQWGSAVFISTSLTACWTGKLNSGEGVSEGVYFFILNGKSICDQKIDLKGTITLFR